MASRRITVVDIHTDPTRYPVAFSVEVASETSSEDDPARLQITVTNRGEDVLELHSGWPGVFGRPFSEERDPGLILVPPGKPPGRVLPHGERRPTGYAIPGYLQIHELVPGSDETLKLEVLSQNPTDPSGWIPEGKFTFRQSYKVEVADTGAPVDGEFDWGFSLVVEPAT